MKKILGTLIVAGIITVCYAASYVPQPHHPFGERILLIINFNHPYYKNIQFFNEVYTKEFPHIVFYGELAAEGVGQCRTQSGVYAYKTLADAMEKYPDYDGYLWLNDDCGITMAHVKHFDKSKIWAPCSGFGRTSGSGLIDLRKDEVDFFHPIKLSNPENQEFMKRVFNEY